MSDDTRTFSLKEALMVRQRKKYNVVNPKHVLKLYQVKFGGRFCTVCRTILPLENFSSPDEYRPRDFVCKVHPSNKGRPVKYKDPEARLKQDAAISLKHRAREDKAIFGHPIVDLSLEETQAMLTEEHIKNPMDFSIVPLRPTEILSKRNAIIITYAQRKYVTGLWRAQPDAEAYQRDLALLLEAGRSTQ